MFPNGDWLTNQSGSAIWRASWTPCEPSSASMIVFASWAAASSRRRSSGAVSPTRAQAGAVRRV